MGASEPPYPLNEQQILKLLKDREFLEQLRDKFIITLGVDSKEHQYYSILAHALGNCCDEAEDEETVRHGFGAEKVKRQCDGLGIRAIMQLKTSQVGALLDELVDLNILRSEAINGETRYAFSRPSFRSMLGSAEDINDKLLEFMQNDREVH